MDIRDIKAFLSEPMAEVEKLISDELRSDIALLDATNRSLLSQGGKRVRPMLSLLAAGACGGVSADSVRFAATSELMHNATLLHDDVVDGATLRRGKPTVMSLLSSPASVLVGDYWLVKAIRCILSADRYSEQVVRLYAKTLSDLAEGELFQMQKASSADTTREDYLRIVYCKTASLFEAAALSGAISAGAPEEWTAALAAYARNLGIAFQMRDDIFDYAGDAALGKPVGIDLQEQKITLPLLCALETVSEEKASEIRGMVAGISSDPALAPQVRAFVLECDGVSEAGREVDRRVDEAISALEELPRTRERDCLVELARFVARRTY